jgi:2-keto-4-pentenoate hydratase/2-oxohepta-3-ene-1,7-dioic acid hydratase in catechol pathway
MKIARIEHLTADGVQPRVVVAAGEGWNDVRVSERMRLERQGATPFAAARLATALVPGSLTQGLELPVDMPAYRDFMSFEQHFVNAGKRLGRDAPDVLYELPVSYMGSAQAFVGPDDEVPWPSYTNQMDYELELGIVVGRGGRDLTPDQALEHVLGLTILNDFSARDIQGREMAGGLGPSKSKHFASAAGPAIVTLDELDVESLRMSAQVNGETWSTGSSGTMLWSIGEIVAWASTGEVLAAGTLLGSGTVGGGCGLELDRYLEPGDVVELEVQGIGVLRNRLMQRPEHGWMPEPRQRQKGPTAPAEVA